MAVLTLCVSGCAPGKKASSQSTTYTVVKIRDGDSIVVLADSIKTEVRLFGIDAPESDQPYAKKSRRETEQLLNGEQVIMRIMDQDRYGRVVANVFIRGESQSINAQLVERGAAWVYRRYSNDKQLLALEKQAKNQRRGLWAADPGTLIPPWNGANNNVNNPVF